MRLVLLANHLVCSLAYFSLVIAGLIPLLQISRDSIDAVKDYFRDEMSKSDWKLIMELKRLFQIL